MAFIAYVTNKKTGVVYAYSQESYRDPVTKKTKSKRTYLGRVDPVTHEIVEKAPDGKRNRTKLGTVVDPASNEPTSEIAKLIQEQQAIIDQQRQQINELTQKYNDTLLAIKAIDDMIQRIGNE
ncbi:MAG: hypothetical protein IJ719_05485 [Clostridia bacterium]|nr:hypothetical protein [Clostridia bacterium]